MSALPTINLKYSDSDHPESLYRVRSTRVVPIEHERKSLIRRIAGRSWREFRSWHWRRSLNVFGPRSSIDAPAWVVGGRSISIGSDVHVWRHARIEAINADVSEVRIEIGDRSVIHPYVHIGAIEKIRIGQDVLMASHVYITDHDHDLSNPDEPVIRNRRVIAAPVEIGDEVWLGERVMVLKGVRIGRGSIIGAGSIVTRDVPPYSLAVGAPARTIKTFDHDDRTWRGLNA